GDRAARPRRGLPGTFLRRGARRAGAAAGHRRARSVDAMGHPARAGDDEPALRRALLRRAPARRTAGAARRSRGHREPVAAPDRRDRALSPPRDRARAGAADEPRAPGAPFVVGVRARRGALAQAAADRARALRGERRARDRLSGTSAPPRARAGDPGARLPRAARRAVRAADRLRLAGRRRRRPLRPASQRRVPQAGAAHRIRNRMTRTPAFIDYEHGITAIDSGFERPMLDAVHLVVEGDRAALVDTASNASLPRVLAVLAAKGLSAEQVDWVLLTHVHLDHAGGAGLYLQHFPNARLTVHPRGARHMTDPTRLVAGTVAVYGADEARRMYGDIVPVAAERVVETPDGASVSLNGRRFEFLDTPGHARHHVCIVDERSGHVFAGDTFGLSYRELDVDGRPVVFPSTTPVQFDPPALHASIDRLLARRPDAVYVTHFGQVRDVQRCGED